MMPLGREMLYFSPRIHTLFIGTPSASAVGDNAAFPINITLDLLPRLQADASPHFAPF